MAMVTETAAIEAAAEADRKIREGNIVDMPTMDAPDAVYPAISDDAFPEGEDYIDGNDIKQIAERLVKEHPDLFGWMKSYKFDYRWRKQGGKTKDKLVYGTARKATTHDRYLLGRKLHFFITLSADNVRESKLTRLQVEALIFHELCHCSTTDKGTATLVAHEFEGFKAELAHYGAWSADLQRAEDGFVDSGQLRLWDDDDEGDEEDGEKVESD